MAHMYIYVHQLLQHGECEDGKKWRRKNKHADDTPEKQPGAAAMDGLCVSNDPPRQKANFHGLGVHIFVYT